VARHVGVFALPEGMSYAEGASLPVNLATAYHCLFHTGMLSAGDRVLIHAAAGGVGQLAVQMAKQAGCEVFATAGSAAKLQILHDRFGVDHGIDYVANDFVAEVRRITGVAKVGCLDVILDPIGGTQLKSGVELLRANGRVVSFGVSSLSDASSIIGLFSAIPKVLSMLTFNSIELLRKSRSVVGVNMLEIAHARPAILRKSVVGGLELIIQGKVKTIISKLYDWRQVGQAQADMENRKTTGKIVFLVNDPNVEGEIPAPIDITESYVPPHLQQQAISSQAP
jgi:NADPH:quinone reductase-like Zn-dependent oxidoreductase